MLPGFLAGAVVSPIWLTVFSKAFSLLVEPNSRLVIGLWSCRNCPDSSPLPPRLWLEHGAEMYFTALPLVAIEFTPTGALLAGADHGGVSDA